MQQIVLYTDGSYKKRDNSGGWACLISCGNEWRQLAGYEYDTTNNRMELRAVTEGLKQLMEPCEVLVVSDSKLVVSTINSWIYNWVRQNFTVTGGGTPLANSDLIRDLYGLMQQHKVTARWVRSHTRATDMYSLGNNCCDWFAQYRQ